jgi:hydroxymethylbilane synthase
MQKKIIRIATRQSPLALWQANHCRTLLLDHHPNLIIELLPMVTSGDKFIKDKLLALGGKGLFVKELEEALLDKRADLAIHSMKDVPHQFPKGLCLPTILKRANPYDALISKEHLTLAHLPEGAVIGTSSLRRQSQLLNYRPDFVIKPLRGNIGTRLEKLNKGNLDAIILAVAGLERMAMQNLITEQLDSEIMLPACGQGALGIECREDDTHIQAIIAPLNDAITATCVHSERHINTRLGGNCHVPIAIYCALFDNETIRLKAKVASADGSIIITHCEIGAETEASLLAEACAAGILAKGASALLSS